MNYLKYRECSFNFYAGYCEKNKLSGTNRFVKAARGYKGLENVFGVSEEEMVSPLEQSHTLRKYHLFNSIGESYSKAVQYYCDEPRLPEMEKQYGNEISQHAGDAIKYCKMAAVECAELDARSLSVFFRNLGYAYERSDRLAKLQGGDSRPQNRQDDIIDAFKKSLSYALAEDAPTPSAIKSAYLALVTYLGNCSIESKREDLLKDFNLYALQALNCFPWSLNFVILCKLAEGLSKGKSSGTVTDDEIKMFASIRKLLSDRIVSDEQIINNEQIRAFIKSNYRG